MCEESGTQQNDWVRSGLDSSLDGQEYLRFWRNRCPICDFTVPVLPNNSIVPNKSIWGTGKSHKFNNI